MVYGMATTEILLLLLFSGGMPGVPLGMPPGPEDPLMAQVAPEECLMYTTWTSTVAPNPDNNVTERWMAQPEIRQSFEKLKNAIRSMSTQGGDSEEARLGQISFQLAEKCLTKSVALYVSSVETVDFSPTFNGGALIDLGEEAGSLVPQVDELIAALLDSEKDSVESKQIGDLSFKTLTHVGRWDDHEYVYTWGVVKDHYLALTLGEGEMEKLVENIETPPPVWLTNVRTEIPVDRISSVCWVNLDAWVEVMQGMIMSAGAPEEVRAAFEAMGIDQLESVGWIAGLESDGFICRGAIHIEGQPRGLLNLFGESALEPQFFDKVAADRQVFMGVGISASRAYETIEELMSADEFSRQMFESGVDSLNRNLGLDIEKDILNQLDEYAYVYGSFNFANPTSGWVLGIGASQEMVLNDPLNKVTELIRSSCRDNPDAEFSESEVEGIPVYTVRDTSEWGMMPNFTWAMADGQLLISLDATSIRRHLRREPMADDALVQDERFSALFDRPHMEAEGPIMINSLDVSKVIQMGVPLLATFGADAFPEEFDFTFEDLPSVEVLTNEMKPNVAAWYRTPRGFELIQRQTYPGGTPGSALGLGAIGLVSSAVTVRRTAARTESANNMRQFILAMHNYHDANRGFPPRFSKDADGKPLLSWRVHILPYLEAGDLYREFHLDEPWDSEHNKALIERMPRIFEHPRMKLEGGKTVYVVPSGDSIFGAPEATADDDPTPIGTKLEEITDGSSKTAAILEVNAENAVIWTKPDDYQWEDMETAIDGLYGEWRSGGAGERGANVALADGSVHFIELNRLREIFSMLVDPSDGGVPRW